MFIVCAVPGKKQFLRRWEEETNSMATTPMTTTPMTTIPMATSLADNLDTQQDDSECMCVRCEVCVYSFNIFYYYRIVGYFRGTKFLQFAQT